MVPLTHFLPYSIDQLRALGLKLECNAQALHDETDQFHLAVFVCMRANELDKEPGGFAAFVKMKRDAANIARRETEAKLAKQRKMNAERVARHRAKKRAAQ